MAAINFKDLFTELETNLLALAKASFKSLTKQAEEDAKNLLDSMKDKLQRWATLLAEGKLTTDDFELLITAQKDLIEMTALQKAGLAVIKAEQFRDSVVNLITDTVFSAIPGL